MPSTFSIENINLNGHTLTTRDGRLFIDNEQIKNVSGIPLTERYFIKGYAPVSFYSRWSTMGTYLNETFFNDFFMVTGYLVSCTVPATGSLTLNGRFYSRSPNSVIETETISFFNLPPRTILSMQPLDYKLQPNRIIGVDIFAAPNELKSISLNLLGYSPAAGHFDRMPASITFYEREHVETGFSFYEKYNQYDATYTGIKIMSLNSGMQSVDPQNITGYISGILNKEAIYSQYSNQNNLSGYIINNQKYFFGTGSNFNQFNNIPIFFNPSSGYSWSGFQLDNDPEYFYSGYENKRYGSGEIFEPIGTRTVPGIEMITGFISGYLGSGQPFIPLNKISGFRGDPRIGDLPLSSGESGYLIGTFSGFYISGDKYFFETGNSFNGFANYPSIFNPSLGYQYYPIATNSEYASSNYFTGFYSDGSGGYTGELRGYIGYRIIPSGQKISGFIKVKADYVFNPLQINSVSEISGISGYYINTGIVKFLTGSKFSGFDGQSGFDEILGYEYFGFSNDNFIDFSGIGIDVIAQKTITGFISGYLDTNYQFNIYSSNLKTNSGYILDGKKYNFDLPKYLLSGELVNGYISGYMDELGVFVPFNVSNPSIASSGYYLENVKYAFPKGTSFSEFDYLPGFDFDYGYSYTGFTFPLGSGFVGIDNPNFGTGSVTGYIGFRNLIISTGTFNGINSSMTGFNDGLGFEYIVDSDTFNYDGENFIPDDPSLPYGDGVITGNIGYKNILIKDISYGTGILKSIIGYRKFFNFSPLTGSFYYKNDDFSKTYGPGFNLPVGQNIQRINLSNNVFSVPEDKFIGLDINRTLSGINGLSIALFGYYN